MQSGGRIMKLKELIKDIEVLSTNAAPDTEISGIS